MRIESDFFHTKNIVNGQLLLKVKHGGRINEPFPEMFHVLFCFTSDSRVKCKITCGTQTPCGRDFFHT